MNLEFDANEILNAVVVNPLEELESVSTDFITENFFNNQAGRYNFYWVIQYLFDKYKNLIFVENLLPYKDCIIFVFKGGNIIKAVIDKAEENIEKTIEENNDTEAKSEISLDEYTQTKRSDSDFSIYVNYPLAESILDDKAKKDLVFLQILIGCEHISYNILADIRKSYDIEKETIKLDDISYSIPITYLKDRLFTINNLYENYNQKFKDLVEKNNEYFEQIKMGDYDKSVIDFIKNNKNIVITFAAIYMNKNINFDVKNNFDVASKLYNIPMPRVKGFIINDNLKYGMDEINEQNSFSLNKLYNYIEVENEKMDVDSESKNITNHKKDIEIYFSNEKNIPLIADDYSILNINKNKKNNIYNGYSINNVNLDNNYLFNINKNLNQNSLIKQKITGRVIKQNKNNNSLYISSNRTLRFIRNTNNVSFNLIRTKHNFRIFLELPNTITNINGKNVNIKYVHIDLPGEFIDISIPTFSDSGITEIMKNFDKFMQERKLYVQVLGQQKEYILNIYTYTNYGLIHDIEIILFKNTNNEPWLDKKYAKRIERLFRLYFADVKNNFVINEKIQNQLEFINNNLETINKNYNIFQQTNDAQYIATNNKYIDSIIKISQQIDKYLGKQNNFYNLFSAILKPVKKYNDSFELDGNIDVTDDKITNVSNIIKYLEDITKYYKIFVDNIDLPSEGNLDKIQLGGYYTKYLKYKQKYLQLKKLL